MLEDANRNSRSNRPAVNSGPPATGAIKQDKFDANHTLKKLGSHALLSADAEYALAVRIRARIILIHRELFKLPEALEKARRKVKDHELVAVIDKLAEKTLAAYKESPATVEKQLNQNSLFLRSLHKLSGDRLFRADDFIKLEEYLLCVAGNIKSGAPDTCSPWLIKVADRVKKLRFETIPMVQDFAGHNTRLVLARAKQAAPHPNEFDDYVSAGNYGLMRAIERFEPERGYKFSTYASWWIKQAFTELRRCDVQAGIRIPEHSRVAAERVNKATADFLSRHGHEPSDKELSEWMGTSVTSLKKLQKAGRDLPRGKLFTDLFSTGSGVRTPEEGIAGLAAGQFEKEGLSAEVRDLREAISTLTDNQRQLLSCLFGDAYSGFNTLEAVGRLLHNERGQDGGVTRERVRQIKISALKGLLEKIDPELAKEISERNRSRFDRKPEKSKEKKDRS